LLSLASLKSLTSEVPLILKVLFWPHLALCSK
jgi:hypothetical protein